MKTRLLLCLAVLMALLPAALAETEEPRLDQGLYYVVRNGGAVITDWNRISYHCRIPDTLGGYPVTEIGDSAFVRAGLRSVVIPEGVTRIGKDAFALNNLMTSVTFPKSLTQIDAYAFCECYSLAQVTLPDALTEIGPVAFGTCSNLKTVVLGNGLRVIGSNAFGDCVVLSSINLPDSLQEIGSGAFWGCSRLLPLTVPASVTGIGDGAFEVGPTLEVVPGSPAHLYAEANHVPYYFAGAVTGQEGIFSYRVQEGGATVTRVALDGAVTSLTIPATLGGAPVIALDGNLFGRRIDGVWVSTSPSLTSVTLPDTLQSIGDNCFADCNVSQVNLPASLRSIGAYAFFRCPIPVLHLPRGLSYLGESAFAQNSAVTEITVPGSLKSIPAGAFSAMANTTLTRLVIEPGVVRIGEKAFNNNQALAYVELPATLTAIGDFAFWQCYGMTSLDVPDSVTELGRMAFRTNDAFHDDLTLYVGEGTAALAYAQKRGNDVKYVLRTDPRAPVEAGPIAGDLNEDGQITAADAAEALRILCTLSTYIERLDANGDGRCDLADVTAIMLEMKP